MLQRPAGAQGTLAAAVVTLAGAVAAFVAARAPARRSAPSPSAFVPAGHARAPGSRQSLGSVVASAALGGGHGRAAAAGCAVLGAAALGASRRAAALRRPAARAAGARRRAAAGEQRAREGKQVGDAVWFDVTLSLPLGLGLTMSTQADGVFVDEVREGGSAFRHNQRHALSEDNFGRQHFLQKGDRLIMVDGQRCGSVDEAVAHITGAADQENLQLKFVRKLNGNVTIIFPDSGTEIAAPGQARVMEAANMAGHNVVYNCTDGTCGDCWHKDERTGEIYLLCQEDCKVGLIPSQSMFLEEGLFFDLEEYQARQGKNPNFDNTEPLVLRTCPEAYEEWKQTDVAQGIMADLKRNRLGLLD